MILVTTNEIEGRKVQTIGLVKGSTIQTVNAIRDFGAGLKTLVGGELVKYNEMMNNARALQLREWLMRLRALALMLLLQFVMHPHP